MTRGQGPSQAIVQLEYERFENPQTSVGFLMGAFLVSRSMKANERPYLSRVDIYIESKLQAGPASLDAASGLAIDALNNKISLLVNQLNPYHYID